MAPIPTGAWPIRAGPSPVRSEWRGCSGTGRCCTVQTEAAPATAGTLGRTGPYRKLIITQTQQADIFSDRTSSMPLSMA